MVSDLKEPIAPGGLLWEGWVFDSRLASVWSGSLCCGLSEGASITSHFTSSLLGDFNKLSCNCIYTAKKKKSTSPCFSLFQGTKFPARVLHSPQLLVDKALGGNVVLEKAALDLSGEGGKECVRAVLKAEFLGPGHS